MTKLQNYSRNILSHTHIYTHKRGEKKTITGLPSATNILMEVRKLKGYFFAPFLQGQRSKGHQYLEP